MSDNQVVYRINTTVHRYVVESCENSDWPEWVVSGGHSDLDGARELARYTAQTTGNSVRVLDTWAVA